MNAKQTIKIGLLALLLAVFAGSALAADPYSGQTAVGSYYQYTNTGTYSYSYGYEQNFQYYDYIAPPRGGGWFGSGTEWIVGLRSPVYTPVPPVHYTNYYQQTCGLPCWFGGGYGYPRATASQFPYRSRAYGIFSY